MGAACANLESWFYRLELAREKRLVRGIRSFSAKSAGEMGDLPGLKRIASHKSEFGSTTSLLKTLATRYASPALPIPHGGEIATNHGIWALLVPWQFLV